MTLLNLALKEGTGSSASVARDGCMKIALLKTKTNSIVCVFVVQFSGS